MWERLYKKPKATRQIYAFWYAAGITAVVAVLWAVTLEHRFTTMLSSSEEAVEEVSEGAFSQFFGDAKDNFANVFSATEEPTTEDDTTPPSSGNERMPTDDTGANVRSGLILEPQTNPVMQVDENDRKRPVLIGTTSEKSATSTGNTR